MRSLALGVLPRIEPVNPAFPPLERRRYELVKVLSLEQMLERPPVRRVRDQNDARSLELLWEVGEKESRPLDDIPVALPAGKGLVHVIEPHGVDLGYRAAVQLAVVALAKPRVLPDWDPRARKRDLRGLDGAREIRCVHAGNPVASPSLAERLRLLSPTIGQPPFQPAGRDPGLVVGRRRVGLVDERDHMFPFR